jgi:hypothetical protein
MREMCLSMHDTCTTVVQSRTVPQHARHLHDCSTVKNSEYVSVRAAMLEAKVTAASEAAQSQLRVIRYSNRMLSCELWTVW